MKVAVNIAIVLSVLLNGALLIYLFGALSFFLFVSVAINVVLILYAVNSIALRSELENDLEALYEQVGEFTDHLDYIHSLEMYYGDQNLQNLIGHSRQLINNIIDFQLLYSNAEVEIEPDTDKEEETTKTEE